MDTRYLPYIHADADFYDAVWQDPGPDLLAADADLTGVGVTVRGPWRILACATPLPETGWKVHVSCRPERAVDVVGTTVRTCLEQGITCKHLLSEQLVLTSQAKYADPVGAGKVVTAYPHDEAALTLLLTSLGAQLAGEPGARVLSDIPWSGAPISVRYGAFVGFYQLDDAGAVQVGRREQGEIVADDRSPHASGREDRQRPALVDAMATRAADADAHHRLDVTNVRVLHRSNGGGVYAATWPDGREVVLKEARHHTGFDPAGTDAVTRLRHEHRALRRLSGSGIAPEVVDYLELGDSDFLVMDHVAGTTATTAMATRHPAVVPGGDGPAYLAWVERIRAQVEDAVAVLADRGIVHLDLHAGNVIDTGTGIALIDFESCALDGVAVATGIADPLAHAGDDLSPEADRAAVVRMRHALVNPLYTLTTRRPELGAELLAAGLGDLGAPVTTGRVTTGPDHTGTDDTDGCPPGPDRDRLLAGLRFCATPEREDRLFPGDAVGIGTPAGSLGLMHGAAGVLATLTAVRAPVPEAWRDWLLQATGRADWIPAGLADGADGLALCLARLGEIDAARGVVARWGTPAASPWWGAGAAGQAAARAELAAAWGDEDLMASALRAATTVIAAVDRTGAARGHRAGLLAGWSGVGLALLRVAELVERTGLRRTDAVVGSLRSAAERAMTRELEHVRVVGDAWMTADGARAMPYLAEGSAGLSLIASALRAQPGTSDPGEADRVLQHTRPVLTLRGVGGAGLLRGRLGLALTLASVDPTDAALEMHCRRLRWYTVPGDLTTRSARSHAAQSDLVLGDQNLRCSADLGTGAAGLLLVAGASGHAAAERFRHLLALPETRSSAATASVASGRFATPHPHRHSHDIPTAIPTA